MTYSGKRVVILGLARQGAALARYLAARGAQVVVSDMQPAEKLAAPLAGLRTGDPQSRPLPIEYVLGGHPASLLDGADLLCLSGGVDANIPLAQAARERGLPLSNDTQIFLEACPTRNTVGITGSAGKTTTTTLVGRILAAKPSLRVWVGGNIGNPLIADVERMTADDMVVLELSSFQLEITTLSTRVAAVLNVTPNHLDRHGTMEAYLAAKYNLLRYQPRDGVAVLGWDNAVTRRLNVRTARTAFFSGEVEFETVEGAFLRGERLIWRWDGREHEIGSTAEVRLRGRHNVLNVLAACAISGAALSLTGIGADVAVEAMRAGIAGFTGVEHRLEFVREREGVRWYNDSIASAPERVIADLHSYEEPIVLLAGGRDKKLPWEDLAQLARARVKHVVLFGEAGPLIQRALEAAGMERFTRCAGLQEAVLVAAQQAQPGDVVLLSPGGTSFDEFKDFAERGEKFKQWVMEL
jgi:UDP-N-acetylmuramoylalanine--D-glutamate ligase